MKGSGAAVPGAPRRDAMAWRAAAAATLAAVACSLQGCDVPRVTGYLNAGDLRISTHKVANWRQRPDYWETNSYRDRKTGLSSFNSCMGSDHNGVGVCNGHGRCMPFDPNDLAHPFFFCKCADDWGGLECSHRRKRQSVAWLLSLILGPLGADEAYLGWAQEALQKQLLTVLGLLICTLRRTQLGLVIIAVPWVADVVRIGMSPVQTFSYRLAPDLPRSVFTTMTIMYFAMIAAAIGVSSMYYTVLQRRRWSDQMHGYTGYMATKA